LEYFSAILALLIALAAGLFWPERGVVARIRRSHARAKRTLLEDFLKHIHAREIQGNLATTESLAGSYQISRSEAVETITRMERKGLVSYAGGGIRLSPDGAQLALQIVRAHRLLERYLFDELGMPLGALHAEADRREHRLSPREIDELDARLGYPTMDPHGDPIPTGSLALEQTEAVSLIEWPDGRPARIEHLEDEPPELFDQILAAGLSTGMNVEILDRADGRLILYDGERQYVVSELAATNVFVRMLARALEAPRRLSDLDRGESGRVRSLETRGLSRRRLLDLGLVPGTLVTRILDAPLGEPVAYRIRGSLIALRREDARGVLIEAAEMGTGGDPC
jgi:DtxR family Mn-dependent transcriptional regulator